VSPALPLRIAVDAMGSDHGPSPLVLGALQALAELGPDLRLSLVGREDEIRAAMPGGRGSEQVEVVAASEVVSTEEAPTVALRRKKDSSIRRAAEMVAQGEADGVVSAGPTGAVTATMQVVLRPLSGVLRPSIAAVLPSPKGPTLLLDCGANVDCRPEWLLQFAVMGQVYGEVVMGKRSPRVALLSIGEEAGKGNELTRAVHALLQRADLTFIGNIDGRDVLAGRADVVVCDGFTGNAVLKLGESVPPLILDVLRSELEARPLSRLGLWLLRPALRRAFERLDWESYGGAPLLGVDGACIICHGRSGPKAIRNAIRVARDFVRGGVRERIAERLKGVA
jgi:glycerol-3-phosphate acyltransferase PlsX